MENNLLTGTLHGSTLLHMSHLETLSISDNDLSGLIPGEEIGSLPSLHYLYLDTNHFVGPLPSQLAQVGKAQLLEIWAQDNALSGTVPASYVRFDKLHNFFIDGNKLTGELSPDLCGPDINSDFFADVPTEAERNYCDGIACPAGSVAFEGVFPCTKCPGGEAARLKNRYLGQTGECSDYSQRDILKITYKATTKGGTWRGVSDWDDDNKNVCQMTGITCDAKEHIVEIALKNRGLEGHLPDEIGALTFLESLDVSDNNLMGYVPSDLQWTAITRLDLSGNKIRGIVPPLLCMMKELNGNGEDDVFYCDRIACPEGTFNAYGYHHGERGEACKPCYDETPFIGQKTCANKQKPESWQEAIQMGKDAIQMAEDASEQMGVSPLAGLGIVVGAALVLLMTCWMVKKAYYNPRKMYRRGLKDDGSRSKYRDKTNNYNREEDDEDDNVIDDYSFADSIRYSDQSQHIYKDSLPHYEDEYTDEENNTEFVSDYEDDNISRGTRSAADLVNEHQGLSMNRRQKFKKAVSQTSIGRKAREAASSINVGVKSQRLRISQLTPGSNYTYESADDDGNRDDMYDDEEEIPSNLELARTGTPGSLGMGDDGSVSRNSYGNVKHDDMLDVPMIT